MKKIRKFKCYNCGYKYNENECGFFHNGMYDEPICPVCGETCCDEEDEEEIEDHDTVR